MTYDYKIKELLEKLNDEDRKAILNKQYGVGGVHWCCGAGRFKDVLDIDARSFYPHILLNYDLLPEWINKDKYAELLANRIAGDNSEKLKMALNVPTGQLRMKSASPEDKERGLAMCLIGQALILTLKHRLEQVGCRIIQINTDGIMCTGDSTIAWDTTRSFQRQVGIPFRIEYMKSLVQADVNNYYAVLENGVVICKGAKFKNPDCKFLLDSCEVL